MPEDEIERARDETNSDLTVSISHRDEAPRLTRKRLTRRWRSPAIRVPADIDTIRVLASPASQSQNGNPYIPLLYSAVRAHAVTVDDFSRRKLVRERYHIIHVHWPEHLVRWSDPWHTTFLDITKVLAGLALARWRGARLVLTGHDLKPHEHARPRLASAYFSAFRRMVDLVINLGDAAGLALRNTYPQLHDVRAVTVPHGHYVDAYPEPPSREIARHEWNLSPTEPVLLCLGQIRRYKNLPQLVNTVGPEYGRIQLVVAGRAVETQLAEQLKEAVKSRPNVRLILRELTPMEVASLHAAADVIVLPYSDASSLHSGAALLALSMGKATVVSATPTMQELRDHVGNDWVVLNSGGPARALELAVERARSLPSGSPNLASLDWENIGTETVRAYRTALQDGNDAASGRRNTIRN